ncbi:hypothetical protein [Spirosoma spitsbergense]|uniref:hypothetical protein n=1 Tax=Spirosoma spitsbergense TaxID=431554 RepID=UPI00037D9F0E|nr:hypothetical protein [Spirosoma spitsbergense]
MLLILCHLHDVDAAWLCQRLQQADPDMPVLIVSMDELLFAREVTHTLGRVGNDFSITLQNGRRIEKNDVSVVINRLYHLDPVVWKQTDPRQYQYVSQEINALYLSLLHTLEAARLYNPPTPVSLGGRHLVLAEWQLLAVRAGLPISPDWPPPEDTQFVVPAIPDVRVLVLDGQLLGSIPPGITAEACLTLARQSEANLLELHFLQQDAAYVFVGATVFPTFHHYGDELIHLLINRMSNGSDLGYTERIAHPAFA